MEQDLPQLLRPEDLKIFTPDEEKQIYSSLANPLIQRYFKVMFLTAQNELLVNETETIEQEQKLLSRFKKFKGIQYVCTFIRNNFGPPQGV